MAVLSGWFSKGRPFDVDCVALVAESAEKGIDHGAITEEVGPFLIFEIRGDDRREPPVTLFHQLEEDIGLFGLRIEVAQLIDVQDRETSKPVEEPTCGAIGKRGVHFVEEILRSNEEAAVAVLQSLQQEP